MAYSIGGIAAGSTYYLAAVADTVKLVKTGPTILLSVTMHNTTAADAFLQCHNKAAATDVTLGTTAPDFVIPVAANGIQSFEFPLGALFPLGLCIAGTTAVAGASAAAIDVSITFG